MEENDKKAARQMYSAIVNYSGICFDPCEHDDCQHILTSAAFYLKSDPEAKKHGDHPRFEQDIKAEYRDEIMDVDNWD